ncbi:uncharacterized protein DUF1543 [Taibaiella chishuiensis]|uniref:Uncharacterized protein DUF1543 n=2 Tax=Taibaiella chishuiensis TaxID=1434707 RepID=A0A2P8CV46_9BACT|nr:uncharacterized protein DUF1543 [Taibaiella chishuiensis]
MEGYRLFMVIVGCKPPGRFTEQHDVFFGIAGSMQELVPDIVAFWPEAKGALHVDAWRAVTNVDGYPVSVVPAGGITAANRQQGNHLFFLNLGGYREGEFEELHYKMLNVAPEPSAAISAAKKTAFYKHCGFEGAVSHIDDKYGVDVDDIYPVKDIIDPFYKHRFALLIGDEPEAGLAPDPLHIGYFKLDKL